LLHQGGPSFGTLTPFQQDFKKLIRCETLAHCHLRVPVAKALHQSVDPSESLSAGRADLGKMPAAFRERWAFGEHLGDLGQLQMFHLTLPGNLFSAALP
jgi:hypothetical protein